MTVVRVKKWRKWVAILAALFLLVASVSFLPVWAGGTGSSAEQTEEEESAEDALMGQIDDLLSELDTSALDEYLATLSKEQREQFGANTFAEKVGALLSGTYAVDYENVMQAVFSLVFDGLSALIPSFCMILSIGILCGILDRFKSSFVEQGTSRLIFFMSYGAVLIIILSTMTGVLGDCIAAVSSMQTQMQAIFPVLLTLIVTCGGSVSAAVYRPAALFLSDGVVQVVSSAVFPLALLICVLHVAGHMNPEVKLHNFCSGDHVGNIRRHIFEGGAVRPRQFHTDGRRFFERRSRSCFGRERADQKFCGDVRDLAAAPCDRRTAHTVGRLQFVFKIDRRRNGTDRCGGDIRGPFFFVRGGKLFYSRSSCGRLHVFCHDLAADLLFKRFVLI